MFNMSVSQKIKRVLIDQIIQSIVCSNHGSCFQLGRLFVFSIYQCDVVIVVYFHTLLGSGPLTDLS